MMKLIDILIETVTYKNCAIQKGMKHYHSIFEDMPSSCGRIGEIFVGSVTFVRLEDELYIFEPLSGCNL